MNKWEQEPDRKKWVDSATGLTCLIIRMRETQSLCGYVRIPENHPLYELHYGEPVPRDLDGALAAVMQQPVGKRNPIQILLASRGGNVGLLFDVHGGVTFSGKLGTEEGYWFGFDCAHAGDYIPGMRFHADNETYRDMEYVIAECESLAKQIAGIEQISEDYREQQIAEFTALLDEYGRQCFFDNDAGYGFHEDESTRQARSNVIDAYARKLKE